MYLCTLVHKLCLFFVVFILRLPLISVSSLFVSFTPVFIYFERGPSFVPLFIQKILEGLEKTEKKDNKKELPFSGRIQSLVSEVF